MKLNLIKKINDCSIKYKMMFVSMLTSIIIVLMASIAFTSYNIISAREGMIKEFDLVARILGANISPFIQFSQRKPAEQTLEALAAKKSVLMVCVYDGLGLPFVDYVFAENNEGQYTCPDEAKPGYDFSRDYFTIAKNIIVKEEQVGSIYILSDLRDIKNTIILYMIGLCVSLVLILILAYAISSRLQRIISSPIINLSKIANEVKKKASYSLRAEKMYNDETGELVETFNSMLAEVEKRDNKLFENNKNLAALNGTITAMVNSLGQGFLTFSKDGICDPVYSKACEIFFHKSPAGTHMAELLKLNKKQKKEFDEWLGLVFSSNHAIGFEDMACFAPKEYNHFKGRYVTLDYKPLYDNDNRLEKVVVIASDETDRVNAENLAMQHQKEAEILINASRNRMHFIGFMIHAKGLLGLLNSRTKVYSIQSIRHEVHTLKGGAGMFAISYMVDTLHEFEAKLKECKDKDLNYESFHSSFNKYIEEIQHDLDTTMMLVKNIWGDDFEKHKSVKTLDTSILKDFYKFLKDNSTQKIKQQYVENILATPSHLCFSVMVDEINSLAERFNKELEPIQITGENIPILTEDYDELFRSFTHISRNVVDHGIEMPDEREEKGKNRAGRISINISRFKRKGKWLLELEFSDDGAGIDPARIRKKLSEVSHDNEWEKEDDETVIQHIFDNDFSTKEEISDISGQGVGMCSVKKEAERLNGSIYVKSKVNEGTSIFITVPYLTDIS